MIIIFLHLSSIFMVVGELDENITPTLMIMMVPYGADRRCCLAHPNYILYNERRIETEDAAREKLVIH